MFSEPRTYSAPTYEIAACTGHIDEWRAEASDYPEGLCYVVTFSGPDSEGRAREYAAWKNGQRRPE